MLPGSGPQTPPMGTSPATGPTPNRGYEAAAVQRLGIVVKQLTDLLPLVGGTSELGQEIMKTIQKLAKHVQPGAVSPAGEKNQLQQALMQNEKNRSMMQQMGGGKPGMPPGAPPGPPPPPAMPQAA